MSLYSTDAGPSSSFKRVTSYSYSIKSPYIINSSLSPTLCVGLKLELKPPVGVRRLREVVQKYHPFFVFQSESSSVGLAMEQEALNLKTPIFIEGFATQITGDECNRYTFRWDASNYAGARSGLAAFLKLHPKVKSFYAIVDNNASGKSMLEEQEAILSSHGGKILKTTFTPLGNADYSSHLTEALSLNPDALIFNNGAMRLTPPTTRCRRRTSGL